MSIVRVIDTLTEWAQANVCSQIQLKQPPADLDAPTDAGYTHELVSPVAFPMYVPTSEKLPPGIRSPFPSLCVRVTSGQDELSASAGFVDIQFCLSTWSTGTHGEDILLPNGNGGHKRWTGEEAAAYFQRNSDGWRDAWNFLDVARRAVENVTNIGGYVLDRKTPVRFGPLTEQESIPDLYPTWFAWVSFRVNYPLLRNIKDTQDFL